MKKAGQWYMRTPKLETFEVLDTEEFSHTVLRPVWEMSLKMSGTLGILGALCIRNRRVARALKNFPILGAYEP